MVLEKAEGNMSGYFIFICLFIYSDIRRARLTGGYIYTEHTVAFLSEHEDLHNPFI
jgi:hypothetical protein